MKKLLSILCLFLAIYANAQTPQAINYQGVARDNNGNVIATHLVALRLSILSGSTSGSTVYVETHSKTTDANGLFSLQIGQGTSITGTFSSITWGSNSYYLKVEIDPAGGTNYQLAGITQFSAVPYALNAANGMPEGQNYGDLLFWNDTTWVTIQHGSVGQVLTLNSSGKPVWQTPPANALILPQLTTTAISSITNITAISGGNITSDGGYVINDRGVCWAIGTTPTIMDNKTSNGTGGGSFTSNLTGLLGNTTYNVRAYATNSVGTGYGLTLSFTTSPPVLPQLTTTYPGNITGVSATSGGNILNNGGGNIIARGVCWKNSNYSGYDPPQSEYPTIADSKTTDSIGSGVFVSNITGLAPGTKYYIRAYATNSSGTAYGSLHNFTTPYLLPTISTSAITSVTSNSATCGINIINNGGQIYSSGICWDTMANPTITLSNLNSSGSSTIQITGLLGNKTYHVRAYATNSLGTVYGGDSIFTTLPATIPTVFTNPVYALQKTSAKSGVYVTSNGGAIVTSTGICWNISANPTAAISTKTIDGTGIMTGLTPLTTYHVRAYAINSVVTAYGNDISFTTWPANLAVGDTFQGGKIAYLFQPGYSITGYCPDPMNPMNPPIPMNGYIPGDGGCLQGEIHGIIVATSDLSNGAPWGVTGFRINNNPCTPDYNYPCPTIGNFDPNWGINPYCNTIGRAGDENYNILSTYILDFYPTTTGIAARICDNLVLNGYNDWLLPTKGDLEKIYQNKSLLGINSNYNYWSSSEVSDWGYDSYAYYLNFSNGSLNVGYKSDFYYVRAVRYF
jgi:hypothetical protein